MKKLSVLFVAMLLFVGGAFAATNGAETKSTNINEKQFPSGSGTITDCNGDTWEVSWSCNYDCSLSAVSSAVANWYGNATGCDPDDYGSAEWED